MISKFTLAMALVFVVSIVALGAAMLAGAPRWELIDQRTEDVVSNFALIAAVVSAMLLALLVVVRAVR